MPAFSALFFLSFFLYLWLRIDPALLWAFTRLREFPCFRSGAAFLGSLLPYPGGPIGYLAAFLSQLYYWSWLGSLIITLLGGLLCLATYGVFQALGGTRVRALYFVPAVLLLVIYSLYGHWIAAVLALLTALLFVNIYARWAPRSAWLRLPAFLLLSAAVYYLAAGGYLVFAVLCGILELLTRRRPFLGACYIGCVAGVPYLAERCLFPISTIQASLRLLPFYVMQRPPIPSLALGLCLFCPVVGLLIALRARFGGGRLPAAEGATSRTRFKRALESPLLVILAAVPVYFSLDTGLRSYFRMESWASQARWRQILQEADRLSLAQYDRAINYEVNRALYHTGQMPDSLFQYVQHTDSLISITPTGGGEAGDIWLELGDVSEAELLACEALEMDGERPRNLQRLALINMVKGETGAARVFLAALALDPVSGQWGKSGLERLQADPQLSTDPEVQRLRSLRPARDSGDYGTVEDKLLALLEANRRNRMAFEYLMSHYLLSCQLDKFALNIHRLDDFDYAAIPCSYEEAILVYTAATGKQIDLNGRRIRPETLERFQRVCNIIASHGNDHEGALREIARADGGSFFWWSLAMKGRQPE
ncbi:MAG: DUF6057 family protein [Candidatus Brocadiia bacterium]|jgi:hypothetical protein